MSEPCRRRSSAGSTCSGTTHCEQALPRAAAQEAAQQKLAACFARLGWRLSLVEVDMTCQRVRIGAQRFDGRLVTLNWFRGTGSLTREEFDEIDETVGRKGDRSRVRRLSVRLLGRARVGDLQEALGELATYVTENSLAHRLSSSEVRAAFHPLMKIHLLEAAETVQGSRS